MNAMLALSSPQAVMAAALLDPEQPGPGDGRFAVHRNNVVAGLIKALAETFPAIKVLVGDAFFDAAAGVFVRQHPPTSPVLINWGGTFPDWIAGFPPAASVPYLGCVARLEWAWSEAFNAAEAEPLRAKVLAGVAEAALPTLRLRLHPSFRVVASRFPVASLWADVTKRRPDGDRATPVDLANAETALLARPHDVVTVRVISPATSVFLDALIRGLPLGDAVEMGMTMPDFDVAAQIASLFDTGLVVGVADQGS